MAREVTAASSQFATISPGKSDNAMTYMMSFRSRVGAGPGANSFLMYTLTWLHLVFSNTTPYQFAAFITNVATGVCGPSCIIGPTGLGFAHKWVVVISGSGATSTGSWQLWVDGILLRYGKITATTYTDTIWIGRDDTTQYANASIQEYGIFHDVPVSPAALRAWFKGAPMDKLANVGHRPSPNVFYHFGYGQYPLLTPADKNLANLPGATLEWASWAMGNAVHDFAPVNYNAGKMVGLREDLPISAAVLSRILYQDQRAAARVVA
jgi:hypothetical protein